MNIKFIKLLIIAVVILTLTSIVFAGQKTDKHFSIFNKTYLPTWPGMDHLLTSYKNHNVNTTINVPVARARLFAQNTPKCPPRHWLTPNKVLNSAYPQKTITMVLSFR